MKSLEWHILFFLFICGGWIRQPNPCTLFWNVHGTTASCLTSTPSSSSAIRLSAIVYLTAAFKEKKVSPSCCLSTPPDFASFLASHQNGARPRMAGSPTGVAIRSLPPCTPLIRLQAFSQLMAPPAQDVTVGLLVRCLLMDVIGIAYNLFHMCVLLLDTLACLASTQRLFCTMETSLGRYLCTSRW